MSIRDYTTFAILRLRPNSQFVITDGDLTNIHWDVLDGEPPTEAEILAAEAEIIAENEAKKAASLAKLAALGLTPEDLRHLSL
jgi:hypothetical protein